MVSEKEMRKSVVVTVLLIALILLVSGLLLPINNVNAHADGQATVHATTSFILGNATFHDSLGENSSLLSPIAPSNGMNINPYQFRSSEPAPMGITDYGISSAGPSGSAYYYFTPSFLGSVHLDSLNAVNSTGSPEVTFQLNVNLYFVNGGSDYTYWIQDVFALNTVVNQVQFIDNVWNFSTSSSQMYASSISGNGGIGTDLAGTHFYYDSASSSLPGDLAYLNYPSSVGLMVNSTISSSGLPMVSFRYNDGYGWQTYDQVTFPFAAKMSADDGFVVDGQTAEPNGAYYDAELILGGPGGGSSTYDFNSEVNLSLQFWNGNNFQEIPSAFNFGSDTAETVSNVVSDAYYYISNGSLFEQLTPGSGSLGQVYSPAEVAFLNINTMNPYMTGTLYINGTGYPFVKGDVNLTLAPGNYSAAIYIGTMLYNETSISLSAGQYLALHWFENLISFTESGLPQNTRWWVNVSNRSYSSTSNNLLMFYISNGTHQFTIQTSNKDYAGNPASSEFTTSGVPLQELSVKFFPVLYEITFTESGLAAGVSWTVSQSATSNSSTSGSLSFYEMNGTYRFSIANLSDYYTENFSLSLTVLGHTVHATVYFNHYAYITGSISPSTAILYIDGNQVSVSNGHFNFSVTAGTHSVNASDSGYNPYNTNLSMTSGEVKNMQISLNKISNPLLAYALIGIPTVVIVGIVVLALRRIHEK